MMALCLKQVFNKDKTFRPRKKFEPGTQRFELYKKAQASLKSGLDLRTVVQLPPGESINDWIAVHVVDFFNRINLIYGTMSEYCTERSCPIMSGGLKYEYRWQDDSKYKKPTKLSAPQYMCMLMDWIEMLINNEDIFPTRIGEWGRGSSQKGSACNQCGFPNQHCKPLCGAEFSNPKRLGFLVLFAGKNILFFCAFVFFIYAVILRSEGW